MVRPLSIRLIAGSSLLWLTAVALADGVSTAQTAVDLANQTVDVARREADAARHDLESAQGSRRSAESRAQGVQSTPETLRLIQDDPRLMDQITADARATERVADDAAASLKAAQARLEVVDREIALRRANPDRLTTTPDLQTLLARREAVAKAVEQLTAELTKANTSRDTAVQLEKQARATQVAVGVARDTTEQARFNAQLEVDRTKSDTTAAEQRYRSAADRLSAAESARDAAVSQLRLALRDSVPADQQALPLDRERNRLSTEQQLRDRAAGANITEAQRQQLERQAGQQKEQFEVEKSRNDALKRADETRQRTQPARN